VDVEIEIVQVQTDNRCNLQRGRTKNSQRAATTSFSSTSNNVFRGQSRVWFWFVAHDENACDLAQTLTKAGLVLFRSPCRARPSVLRIPASDMVLGTCLLLLLLPMVVALLLVLVRLES
jgi:hypothetical protein